MAVRMYEPRSNTGVYRDAMMTPAGVAYFLQHGVPPPDDSHLPVIRADDVISGDGLRQITTFDQSGRPVHTFESVTGRKNWMDSFKTIPLLMTAITNNPEDTRKQHQRYLREHPSAIPM